MKSYLTPNVYPILELTNQEETPYLSHFYRPKLQISALLLEDIP